MCPAFSNSGYIHMDNPIDFLYDNAPFVRKWFKNLRPDSRALLYSGTWLAIFIKLGAQQSQADRERAVRHTFWRMRIYQRPVMLHSILELARIALCGAIRL